MNRLFEPGVKSAIDILRAKGITLKDIEEAYAFIEKGHKDTAEYLGNINKKEAAP